MRFKHMKSILTAVVFSVFFSIKGQERFVSLNLATPSSERIEIQNLKQLLLFKSKIDDFAACTGMLIDAHFIKKSLVSDVLIVLQTHPEITHLSLKYQSNDSIDFRLISHLKNLETLCLQSDEHYYPSLPLLKNLTNLYQLKIMINDIDELPLNFCNLQSLSEIELLADDNSIKNESDFYFNYQFDVFNTSSLLIRSYVKAIDLNLVSIQNVVLKQWPLAVVAGDSVRNLKRSKQASIQSQSHYTQQLKRASNSFNMFTMQVDSASTFIANDHTIIHIPAKVFVDANGKEVKGEVQIFYREFKSADEIVASGLNLIFDTIGKSDKFNSTGMFEIKAISSNEALTLKKNGTIQLDFKNNKDSCKFKLFAEDKNSKWKFKEDWVNLKAKDEKITTVSMKDKTEFANRYANLDYFYLLPKGVIKLVNVPELSYHKKYSAEIFTFSNTRNKKFTQGKALIKLKIDKEKSDVLKGKVVFYLVNEDYGAAMGTLAFFPELKPFNLFPFEFDGEIKTSEFTKNYRKGKDYSDCRIYFENNSSSAMIELKTKDGYISIPVKTNLVNFRGKSRPNMAFRRAFQKYQTLLKIKENKFNKSVNMNYNRSYKDTSIYKTIFINKHHDNNIFEMNINVLGFFHCDPYYRLNNPMKLINPKFVCGDSTLNNLVTAYVLDNDANGTYTFQPSFIYLSYDNMGGILLCDNKGEMYTCTKNEFKQQVEKKNKAEAVVIKVQKIP